MLNPGKAVKVTIYRSWTQRSDPFRTIVRK